MNTFKTVFLSVIVANFYVGCFAQDLQRTKNAFYFELLGSGGVYSINYERNIHQKIYCRIGFATWKVINAFSLNPDPGRITTVPLLVSHLSGYKKHHFEIGGGFLFGNKRDYMESSPIFNLTGFLGYRYQSLINKGLLIRLSIAPFVSMNETHYPDRYFLSPGISLGYHF